jgi:sensor domain CHASE-containing protein
MSFYWKAVLAAIGPLVGIIGVAYLFGDHYPIALVGFVVALSVFIVGVEHLSEKADEIKESVESVEASLDNMSEKMPEKDED